MIIIRDTREKKGWDFPFKEAEIKVGGLKYGDYTVEGLEDVVRIERKASTSEIAQNLGSKKNKERFYRELEKLQLLPNAYIICEFPESNIYEYPQNSGMPKNKMAFAKIGGKFLRKLIHEIEDNFDIQVMFFNSRSEAEDFSYDLLKGFQ